jgi:DNA polymerase type B, organellar and viral
MAGGDVQVFKNYGKNLYHYDINSLYPYVIKNYAMPIGQPTQFEGDILKNIDLFDFFGFAECIVTCPRRY